MYYYYVYYIVGTAAWAPIYSCYYPQRRTPNPLTPHASFNTHVNAEPSHTHANRNTGRIRIEEECNNTLE